MLDQTYFPHIFEGVFAYAVADGNPDTLRLLRAVSRDTRDWVDKFWHHAQMTNSGLHDMGMHCGRPVPDVALRVSPGVPALLDVNMTEPWSYLQHLTPRAMRIFDFPYLPPGREYHLLNAQEVIVLHGPHASLLHYCRAPLVVLRLDCTPENTAQNIDWSPPPEVQDVIIVLRTHVQGQLMYGENDLAVATVLAHIMRVAQELQPGQKIRIVTAGDIYSDAIEVPLDFDNSCFLSWWECSTYLNRCLKFGRKHMLERGLWVRLALDASLAPFLSFTGLSHLQKEYGKDMLRFIMDSEYNATAP